MQGILKNRNTDNFQFHAEEELRGHLFVARGGLENTRKVKDINAVVTKYETLSFIIIKYFFTKVN